MSNTIKVKGLTGDPDTVWTVSRIATVLDVTPASIHKAVACGDLVAFRMGPRGRIRVREEDLLEWIRPYVPASGEMPRRTTTDEAPQSPLERKYLADPAATEEGQ